MASRDGHAASEKEMPTVTQEGTSVFYVRHIVGVAEATVTAEFPCRVCAALLNGFCLAPPISLLSKVVA